MTVIGDAAVKATAAYMESLERCLHVKWTDSGDPVFLPSEVNQLSFQRLDHDLHDVMSGTPREQSISSVSSHEGVQSVAFGLADNFDLMVKLGFLCGGRVVLWDFVWRALLRGALHADVDPMLAGSIATNVLALKELARRGAVVMLPHPTDWCGAARAAVIQLEQDGALTTHSQGLACVLGAVREAGMRLSPYTLTNTPHASQRFDLSEETRDGIDYSQDEERRQSDLAGLLLDERFGYLRDVRATEFYEVISQDPLSFRQELADALRVAEGWQSPAEREGYLAGRRRDLARRLEEQNRILEAHEKSKFGVKMDVVEGVLSTVVTVAGFTSGAPTLGLLGSLGIVAKVWTTILAVVGLGLDKPNPPLLLQSFSNLRERGQRTRREMDAQPWERW